MNNQQQTYKTEPTEKKENLKSKDKYNIILQLYKGLSDNLEVLGEKVTNKKSSSEVSQVAYKVDKIAAGLQYTLDFENEKTLKISENFRELYRHIRFSMKMIKLVRLYKWVWGAERMWETPNFHRQSVYEYAPGGVIH